MKRPLNVELKKKQKNEHFCVSITRKALCLICGKSTSILKEYNITRHPKLKASTKTVCALKREREKMAALTGGLKS
jgi:hypothetical protein